MEDEVNLRQAAEMLGVDRERVRAMVGQGQLSAEKRISEVGTPYLVLKRAEVEALRREREARAAGTAEKPPRGPRPKVAKKEGVE